MAMAVDKAFMEKEYNPTLEKIKELITPEELAHYNNYVRLYVPLNLKYYNQLEYKERKLKLRELLLDGN